MKNKSYLPIKDFSYLTGIKKENLRFYDHSGLLCPALREENGYRYYSRQQLNSAYLISDLRELGVGLAEIKQYATHRTPQKMLALFSRQEARITAEIAHLQDMQAIMALRTEMALEALQHTKQEFLLLEQAAEPIFLCPPPPADMDEDEKGIFSYEYAFQAGVNLSYPIGVILSGDHTGYARSTLQYYFKTKGTQNSQKPAGKYATVYGQCDIGEIDTLYQYLMIFIQAQNLHLTGSIYVDWLLDELSVQETNQYCVRIQIQVL